MDEKELNALRDSVRQIDKDLLALFEKRVSLSKEIAQYKLKAELPIYDAKREEKNIRELSSLIEDSAVRDHFVSWYQMLMDISKKIQKMSFRGTRDE